MSELKKCEHCGGEFDSGDRMMWMQHEAATCVVTKPTEKPEKSKKQPPKRIFRGEGNVGDE